jgi:membrane-associated phospholipid phosphatase
MTAGSAGRWAAPAALFAALAALGAAVEQGALRAIDRFGYAHLQPLHRGDWSHLADAASPAIACALVAIAAVRLRSDTRLAAAWLAVLGLGAAIELVCKPLVEHPNPRPDEMPWLAHEGFPSGHAMRGVIVAGALSAAWPRARGVLIAWAVANAISVEVTRMHVPSEVIGGVLAGVALTTAVQAVRRPADTRAPAGDPYGTAGARRPRSSAHGPSTDAMPGR